jgi:hypothetical protein
VQLKASMAMASSDWYASPRQRLIVGEANIFPFILLLSITSIPAGTATLIGTVWFLSTLMPWRRITDETVSEPDVIDVL